MDRNGYRIGVSELAKNGYLTGIVTSFVPQVTLEILKLIAEIDEFKGDGACSKRCLRKP